MELFDDIAKAAKNFFVEPEDGAAPAAGQPVVTLPGGPVAFAAPVVVQAEQRHIDHIAQLLTGDGKDFGTYLKMVKSMAAAGLSGPMLYQTAFNAFAAVSGATVPGLLASATQFESALTDDRQKVTLRHREKMGEAPSATTGPVVQLAEQEKKLAAELADLTRQLQAKQQLLVDTQQKLAEERQKTQSAMASYELAYSAAMSELQAHHKAAETFLSVSGAPTK